MRQSFLQDDPSGEYVTVREFAKLIGASYRATLDWCTDGSIPHKRGGQGVTAPILIDARLAPRIRDWRLEYGYTWSSVAYGYWMGVRDGVQIYVGRNPS